MTYNVFSGTLNPTHSLTHLLRRAAIIIIWSELNYPSFLKW